MSNTQAICNSFKQELMQAIHALGTTVARAVTTADVLKGALYYAIGTLGAGTTAYGVTNEVASAGYTAGGATVTNANAPSLDTNTAIWTPSASLSWTGVTIVAFDALLLYNSTQSNKAIAIFNFGSTSIVAGNFALNMPTNAAATALLQLA